MKVLIIGGTRFVGREIVDWFLHKGASVSVLSRGQARPPFWDKVEAIECDRSDTAALTRALAGKAWDVVVDNIAFEEAHVVGAAEALGGRCGRYVLMSTASVYRDFDNKKRPIPEAAADLDHVSGDGYADGKRACERAVTRVGLAFTVLRPPVVQGPHDNTRRGWFWIQRVADGGPILVPVMEPAAMWRQVFSRDIARAVELVAGNERCEGKTYNVAMDEILTLQEYVRMLARIMGRKDQVVPVAQRALLKEAPFYQPTYAHRLIQDTTRLKADTGFESTPIEEWVRETAEWHMAQKLEPASGYARRLDEIKVARRHE